MKRIIILLTLSILMGCAARTQYESDSSSMLKEAEELYNRGKYQKAALKLEDLILTNPGSSQSIDAQMLLAKSYFKDKEYHSAIAEFRRLVSSYSANEHSEEAQFMIAECYFALSPRAELDQSYTVQALELYKDFIETNNNSELVSKAEEGIKKCEEKLAMKSYLATELYFKMEDWNAAILYAELSMKEYPDSKIVPDLKYIMGKSYEKSGEYGKARTIYSDFLSSYPDNEHYSEVEKSFNNLVENPDKH